MTALDDKRKKAKAERERARKRKASASPEPEMSTGCAGVLDGRDISVLNTTLRARGLSDHDRYEILKSMSELTKSASETES